MTEEQQLEEMIQADFDKLAYKLGGDILRGLSENYPQRFAEWVADLKFGRPPRYVLNFQARLQPVAEARDDMVWGADTIGEGVN